MAMHWGMNDRRKQMKQRRKEMKQRKKETKQREKEMKSKFLKKKTENKHLFLEELKNFFTILGVELDDYTLFTAYKATERTSTTRFPKVHFENIYLDLLLSIKRYQNPNYNLRALMSSIGKPMDKLYESYEKYFKKEQTRVMIETLYLYFEKLGIKIDQATERWIVERSERLLGKMDLRYGSEETLSDTDIERIIYEETLIHPEIFYDMAPSKIRLLETLFQQTYEMIRE